MRILLIYPKLINHLLYYRKSMTRLGKKSSYPPVGLLTIAAMLPESWQLKLVDCNIREVNEEQWKWADLVMISAMIGQKEDLQRIVKTAKSYGKKVAIGGPYPTASPDEAASSGADFLVLNEGEITLPLFLEALAAGVAEGVFRTDDKPDVTQTPLPRFDLIDLKDYAFLSVQYSRGCPFLCEFCDIITLYGRKPRVKKPEQMIKELESLYQLGWRGVISIIDDNFIANRRHAKAFLRELKIWMIEKGYPFIFITEASVDLALETELLELMVACNFKGVFLGIETPDNDSLKLIKKEQNIRSPMLWSLKKINQAGMSIIAGMMIGIDHECREAGSRIVQMMESAAIPMANLGILQALPTTALWSRLEQEQRLKAHGGGGLTVNFIPTRPVEEIVSEYIDANWQLYDAKTYVHRVYRHCMRVKIVNHVTIKTMGWREFLFRLSKLGVYPIGFLAHIFWQQGIYLESRQLFWFYLLRLLRKKPAAVMPFLFNCALYEDLDHHRHHIRDKMQPYSAKRYD